MATKKLTYNSCSELENNKTYCSPVAHTAQNTLDNRISHFALTSAMDDSILLSKQRFLAKRSSLQTFIASTTPIVKTVSPVSN